MKTYNKADLHLHTTASDGSDSARELIVRARELGLDVISVTDHDTIKGLGEALELPDCGVKIVTGIEFSCITAGEGGFKCHVLGYGFDPDNEDMQCAIAHGREMRLYKLGVRLEYLKETYGITFTDSDLEWLHSLNSVARPHLGQLLIRHGYVSDMAEAFDRYLKMGSFPDDRIAAAEAISAIRAAGGVAVYAHPIGGEREKRLDREEVSRRIEALRELGLGGLECYYSRYSEDDEAMLTELADKYGLLVSGGSDYHGENKTVKLGVLREDAHPIGADALTVLDALCDR